VTPAKPTTPAAATSAHAMTNGLSVMNRPSCTAAQPAAESCLSPMSLIL
jgi:hypothetical protein